MRKAFYILLISFSFLFACNDIRESENNIDDKIKTVVQTGHNHIVQEIYFTNADQMFLSGSNSIYKLWDIKSKRLIGTWDKQPDGISILGFNKDY